MYYIVFEENLAFLLSSGFYDNQIYLLKLVFQWLVEESNLNTRFARCYYWRKNAPATGLQEANVPKKDYKNT